MDSGAAICLDSVASVKGTLHNLAHRADTRVMNLGKQSDIPGLAKISDITDLYVNPPYMLGLIVKVRLLMKLIQLWMEQTRTL